MKFQIRLKTSESLGDLHREIFEGFKTALSQEGAVLSEQAKEQLKDALQKVLSQLISAYDLCGLKIGCFEMVSLAEWNTKPHHELVNPRTWDGIRILELELEKGLPDFSAALVSAATAASLGASQKSKAVSLRQRMEAKIREVFGPHLFVNEHLECDLCRIVQKVDPWKAGCENNG